MARDEHSGDAVMAATIGQVPVDRFLDATEDWEEWLTADGEPTWISSAFERLVGRAVSEAMADPAVRRAAVHPDDRPAWDAHHRSHVHGSAPGRLEFRVVRPDGTVRWFEHMCRPLPSADGGQLGRRCRNRDVTDQRAAERALEDVERRLQLLVDHSRDGIHQLDLRTGRYVFMSAAQERLTGFSREELEGLAAEEAAERLHPDDRERVETYLERVIAGEDPGGPVEYRWRVRSGRYRWFSDSRALIRDRDGAPESLVGVSRDVTDRRRAQDEMDRFFDLSADILAIASTGDGRWKRISPALTRTLGWSEAGALGIPSLELVHPDDLGRTRAAVAELSEGRRRVDLEHRVRCRDGSYRWVAWNTALDSDEGLVYCVGRDTSERRARDEQMRRTTGELERLARTLEERVRQRTADLERRTEQLRQLHGELARVEQRERRHLATLLHDGLQQMLVAARLRLDSVRLRSGGAIRDEIDEIDRVLADTIAASRSLAVELAPPLLHEHGLVAALRWLAGQMERQHDLPVVVDAPDDSDTVEPPVEQLRSLVFQAVRELLLNAAKHSGADTAGLEVRRDGDRLTVVVSDAGRGFDPAALGRSVSFGLASVRQRIEWLGGEVLVAAEPGRGTTVRLEVPLSPAPDQQDCR